MGEYSLTPESVKFILRDNLWTRKFQPDDANALLSSSREFIKELISTPGLSSKEKRSLLLVKNKIYAGKECCRNDTSNLENIFDISEWMPKQTFSGFVKESEIVSLHISRDKPELRIGSEGNIVTWVSSSNTKINAEAVRPSKYSENISSNRWALVFNVNVQYKIEIPLRTNDTTCVCLTFRIENASSDKEQYLVFDKGGVGEFSRGLSFINRSLRIWGVANNENYIDIPLNPTRNEYVTLFVEWPGEITGGIPGRYFINNREKFGDFLPRYNVGLEGDVTTIGGKIDVLETGFEGSIASFDVFSKDTKLSVPDHLIDLIIRNRIVNNI